MSVFPGKQTQYTQTRHRLFCGIWLPNEIMYAARDVTRSLVDGISTTPGRHLPIPDLDPLSLSSELPGLLEYPGTEGSSERIHPLATNQYMIG